MLLNEMIFLINVLHVLSDIQILSTIEEYFFLFAHLKTFSRPQKAISFVKDPPPQKKKKKKKKQLAFIKKTS